MSSSGQPAANSNEEQSDTTEALMRAVAAAMANNQQQVPTLGDPATQAQALLFSLVGQTQQQPQQQAQQHQTFQQQRPVQSQQSQVNIIEALLALQQQPTTQVSQTQQQQQQQYSEPNQSSTQPQGVDAFSALLGSLSQPPRTDANASSNTGQNSSSLFGNQEQLAQQLSALLQSSAPAPQQPQQHMQQPPQQQQRSHSPPSSQATITANPAESRSDINANIVPSSFPTASAAQQLANLLAAQPEIANMLQSALRIAINYLSQPEGEGVAQAQQQQSQPVSSIQGLNNDTLGATLASLGLAGLLPQQQNPPPQQQPSVGGQNMPTFQQVPNDLLALLQAQLPSQQLTSYVSPNEEKQESNISVNFGRQPVTSSAMQGGGAGPVPMAAVSSSSSPFGSLPGVSMATTGTAAAAAPPSNNPTLAAAARNPSYDRETQDLLANIPPMPAELEEMKKRKPRGRSSTFPRKLYQMLMDLEEQEGGTDIASFLLPHGRAFRIHKPKEFCRDVLPKYFQMSSISSFQRQLNLYDFQRVTEGPERDAYYHELFVRGQPLQCTRIKRNKVKSLTRAKQEERLKTYEKSKEMDMGDGDADDD